jgi:RecA/RadA recombinase
MSNVDVKKLAAQMRDRLNADAGKEIARNLTTAEELVQVEDWVNMPEFFERAAGGPGWPQGHISQVIGDSDTGKTTLVMYGMLECQKQGGIVFLIDSEHKFSFERFRTMGGVPEDIIVISIDSLEEAWNAWSKVCTQVEHLRKKAPNVPIFCAWDSVAASVPDAILEGDAEDAHVSVEAKINNKEVRKLRKRVRLLKITAVFINHSYMTMPKFGIPKEVIKGGSEMYFMSTLILKTKRRAWLDREVKGMRQRYGTHSHLEVYKGHLGGKRNTTEFFIVEEGVLSDKEALKAYNAKNGVKDAGTVEDESE